MDPISIGLGALSAGGSILGGMIGSNSQKNALNYQKGQSEKTMLAQMNALEQSRTQMLPYTQAGQAAMPLLTYMQTGQNPYSWDDSMQSEYDSLKAEEQAMRRRYQGIMSSATGSRSNQRKYRSEAAQISTKLARLMELENNKTGYDTISNYSVENSPNYKWQQQQGEKAINRGLAARGMYNSRAGVNALTDFNQSLGAQETENSFNRLSTLANYGMGASANVGNYNIQTGANTANSLANYSNQIGQIYNNLGQTQGSMWANALSAPAAIYQNAQYTNALSGLNKE